MSQQNFERELKTIAFQICSNLWSSSSNPVVAGKLYPEECVETQIVTHLTNSNFSAHGSSTLSGYCHSYIESGCWKNSTGSGTIDDIETVIKNWHSAGIPSGLPSGTFITGRPEVDTGACSGGPLSCVDVLSGRVWQRYGTK